MDAEVKPPRLRRRYDATRRRLAAAETRAAILAAARALFLAHGYAATTMLAIADRAGVALDTVYAVIGPKPALFRELIETSISGTERPVTADERDYVVAIRAEPDPRRKIALYARAIRSIMPRLAPLIVVLGEASRADPELAALWREIGERRAENMRRFVTDLMEAGGLRSGVSLEEAADFVWSTNAPEFYHLLVTERGWTPEQFERWLADTWTRMLLPDPASLDDVDATRA
jgi:AcrR family transcriptional regulator